MALKNLDMRYDYSRFNSLKAESTDNPNHVLWKGYFEVEKRLNDEDLDPEERNTLDQQLRQYKYAIACMDLTEELAGLFYTQPVQNLKYLDLKTRLGEIRKNVFYAKKGGRFRRGNPTPPTQYRVKL